IESAEIRWRAAVFLNPALRMRHACNNAGPHDVRPTAIMQRLLDGKRRTKRYLSSAEVGVWLVKPFEPHAGSPRSANIVGTSAVEPLAPTHIDTREPGSARITRCSHSRCMFVREW